MPKNAEIFKCEPCDFECSKKSNYNLHLSTSKHVNRTNLNKKNADNNKGHFVCNNCNKIYNVRNSLWYHMKKCNTLLTFITPDSNMEQKEDDKIHLLIQENIDFKNIILDVMKNNSDLQKQMLDICKNGTTIINNNNTLNKNKTFNLQFFLNETCKDAMNLMDFVNSISLQLSDLENVKNLGYVDGITGIIVKKINEMEVHKRPIHCSDAKREIMYVREDDIWEKEDDNHNRLRKAIKYISKKNRILLNEWSESHPEANDIHSPQNLEYMLMIVQSMGGKGELVDNENKIMKKIMKNVLIDKIK